MKEKIKAIIEASLASAEVSAGALAKAEQHYIWLGRNEDINLFRFAVVTNLEHSSFKLTFEVDFFSNCRNLQSLPQQVLHMHKP